MGPLVGPAWRIGRAFILMELLVLIAIIAFLESLLLPALGRAKAKVGVTTCLNNLKQWGYATLLYVEDNDDFLPPDGAPNGTSTKAGWYIDLPRTISIPTYADLSWPTNPGELPEK